MTTQSSGGSPIIDHVTLQVEDVEASRRFYETALAPLGIHVMSSGEGFAGFHGNGAGSFWLIPAEREQDRELHIAFTAADRAQVRAFFEAAKRAGAPVLNEPRLFPEYHENYYGAFVRDPDGHNLEAVCHRPE